MKLYAIFMINVKKKYSILESLDQKVLMERDQICTDC